MGLSSNVVDVEKSRCLCIKGSVDVKAEHCVVLLERGAEMGGVEFVVVAKARARVDACSLDAETETPVLLLHFGQTCLRLPAASIFDMMAKSEQAGEEKLVGWVEELKVDCLGGEGASSVQKFESSQFPFPILLPLNSPFPFVIAPQYAGCARSRGCVM